MRKITKIEGAFQLKLKAFFIIFEGFYVGEIKKLADTSLEKSYDIFQLSSAASARMGSFINSTLYVFPWNHKCHAQGFIWNIVLSDSSSFARKYCSFMDSPFTQKAVEDTSTGEQLFWFGVLIKLKI